MRITARHLRQIIREDLALDRALRGIVKEVLLESLGGEYGSSGDDATPASMIVNGRGGYSYEVFPDGRIQIVSTRVGRLPTPIPLNPQAAAAVASEQIDLGNRDPVIARIASDRAGREGTGAQGGATAGAPNLVILGRQDYFPLDLMLGLSDDLSEPSWLGSLVAQGHAFAIVVDPKTRRAHRYDFGRYKAAEDCDDDRLLSRFAQGSKLGAALDKGIHTMGITMYVGGTVEAVISTDGRQITNLPQFLASVKRDKDSPGEVVVITVGSAADAKAYADGMRGKCFPYALPGFGSLTSADTMNCGVFSARVLKAGGPNPPLAIDEEPLLDTPDAMFAAAAGSQQGYQQSPF